MPSTFSTSASGIVVPPVDASAPTADDLRALLRSSNLLTTTLTAAQAETDFEAAIAGAISAWEQATDYVPFIAAQQTREYDPPTRMILPLRAGLLSVSEVRINVSLSNPTGTILVEKQDFRLGPRFAAGNGRPYTYIEFRYHPVDYGLQTWVSVTGLFGFASTWPQDAKNAVIRLAAALLLPEFQLQISKGAIRIKQDDVELQYAPNSLMASGSGWQATVDAALARYTRRTIY